MPIAAELQSTVITNSIGLVLLASLLLASNMTRRRRNLDDLLFTAMIFICAGACLCEMTTWLVNGHPESWARIVNYVGNECCYLATGGYAYLWVLYVDARFHQSMRRIARWHPALLVPTALIMFADIGSLFGNYMFVIDANNVYHRLPLSYLNYGMAIISLGYSIWLCRSLQRRRGAARFFPIAMFIIPVLVGSGIQAVAERMQQRIHEKAAEFNSTSTEPYQLSLSLGHGTFDPAEQDTPDAFLHRIDERMYEEKREKHAERS